VAAGTYQCAEQYYDKLVEGISESDQDIWEKEIQHAENTRLHDRSGMDILGAKEHRNEAAADEQSEDPFGNQLESEWIRLGITIEEKQ
jgi:hypothetical protein